jgi:bacteriocin biosynthesis cyclodehydratase domain-containing protein
MVDRRARLAEQLGTPEFNPAYVPIVLDDDTVHVRAGPHAGTTLTVSDNDESSALADVVELVDGTNSLDDILEEFGEEMQDELLDFFEYLSSKNVLRDAGETPRPSVRDYAAVKPFGAEYADWDEDDPDVLVVSVGDIGRHMVQELGSLGLAPVWQYSETGPAMDGDGIRAVEREELASTIEDVDVVSFLADRPAPELAEDVNEITHRTDTPWQVGQIQGFDAYVGPTIFPGETACYRCFHRRTLTNVDDVSDYRSYLQQAESGQEPSPIPFLSRTVAGYAGLDLLNLLAFGQGLTAGRVVHFDALDLSVSVDDVLKLPRCGVCGVEEVDQSRFVSNLDALVEHLDHEVEEY